MKCKVEEVSDEFEYDVGLYSDYVNNNHVVIYDQKKCVSVYRHT